MRVAVARASTQDTAVTEVAPKTAKIMRFDDDASAVQALLSDQVDAIGVSNVVAREHGERWPPGQYELKFVLSRQFQRRRPAQGPGRNCWPGSTNSSDRSRPTAS